MEDLGCIQEFKKIISFDTTSDKSNVHLIEWIGAYLTDLQFNVKIYKSENNYYANIYAWIGPDSDESILLCGHSDTVPVEGKKTIKQYPFLRS